MLRQLRPALMSVLVVRWRRRPGWRAVHQVALSGGAMFTSAWGSFVVGSLTDQTDLISRAGCGQSPF